jgi:hypothetical protein
VRKNRLAGVDARAHARQIVQALSARQTEFERKGGIPRNGPLYRFYARNDLRSLRERFDRGDRHALMLAIRKCAQHDLVMPGWVAEAYIEAFDRVNHYRARSWDAVFGSPVPKGAHLKALRDRLDLSLKLHNKMRELKDMKKNVPWDALCAEFNVSKTVLQDLYYGRKRGSSRKKRKKAG